jgi:2-(1,2-epoxy-1,2-dihydrophenyl)acetyl-CoA isomerase
MPVSLEVNEAIATLTLADPENLNVLDDGLTADVLAALEKVGGDESIRALILTGAGRAFSAGGKLSMLAEMVEEVAEPHNRQGLVARMRNNSRIVEVLRSMPQLTIAAVNGACVGAAIGWICACDLRIAAEAAKFNTAFLTLGLPTDFGTATLLAEVVGGARAADWLLRPRPVTALEALAAGLVGGVVGPDVLLPSARQWASLTTKFPAASTALKKNLRDAERLPLAECLDAEAERFTASLAADEAAAQIRRLGSERN